MSSPLQIAIYISAHGYGHLTRTLNLLSLLSHTGKYNFHIRTPSPLYENHLTYALHPSVIQTNAYQLSASQSLHSLLTFNPSFPHTEEANFLKLHNIRVIISDALPLPCLLGHTLKIPVILITNFTFDSIFQALLDNAPPEIMNKEALQLKVDEMSAQYAMAYAVIRLPGYIPFRFEGPRMVDAPLNFRKALRSRNETFASLGFPRLSDKKVLLHCFGGHALSALAKIPSLPEGWTCLSQTIDCPPLFHKISRDLYMPDLIAACDAVLGKLGWGMCSEVIGNGYKPFIYVPRSSFIEEAGLLSWMGREHGRIVRLGVEKYEGSDWRGAIEEAEKMNGENEEGKEDWEENDAELVRIFEDTLESALNYCKSRGEGSAKLDMFVKPSVKAWK